MKPKTKTKIKVGAKVYVDRDFGPCSGGPETIKKITKNYIRTHPGPFGCFRRGSGHCIVKGSPYYIMEVRQEKHDRNRKQ